MKKSLLVFGMLLIVLIGCAQVDGQSGEKADESMSLESKEDESAERGQGADFSIENMDAKEAIAHIHSHGHDITGEDLAYEMKRLELINLISGGNPEDVSPKVAIQEILRMHMIRQIAQEEGVHVDESIQSERAEAVKQELESTEGYEDVMSDYDEVMFWEKETARYETILQAEELIVQMMEKLAETYPKYGEQALRFEAQQDLDEWIQEKVVDAEVEMHIEL